MLLKCIALVSLDVTVNGTNPDDLQNRFSRIEDSQGTFTLLTPLRYNEFGLPLANAITNTDWFNPEAFNAKVYTLYDRAVMIEFKCNQTHSKCQYYSVEIAQKTEDQCMNSYVFKDNVCVENSLIDCKDIRFDTRGLIIIYRHPKTTVTIGFRVYGHLKIALNVLVVNCPGYGDDFTGEMNCKIII